MHCTTKQCITFAYINRFLLVRFIPVQARNFEVQLKSFYIYQKLKITLISMVKIVCLTRREPRSLTDISRAANQCAH